MATDVEVVFDREEATRVFDREEIESFDREEIESFDREEVIRSYTREDQK